ncbi:alpha/beta hydrolase domain-containing protein [Blastococcus sp. SYSU D01042]
MTRTAGSRPSDDRTATAGEEPASAVVRVEAGTATIELGGRRWQRTSGTLHGVVGPGEAVAGLTGLPADEQGRHAWSAEFEVLAPGGAGDLVLVDVENRGRPATLLSLEQFALGSADVTPTGAVYPAGRGTGFLGELDLGYARVQWEAGIAAGVPVTAQGVGQVVLREFGRLLTGAADGAGTPGADAVPRFGTALLSGISQSAWFVTTFLAEGVNVDPVSGAGVYAAALTVSGTGNWLAVNQLAGEEQQRPYLLPDGVPLPYERILTRPESDPLYVDVATYTDYYRLRASVTAHADRTHGALRYDWPAPHAGPAYPDALVFGALGCNGGVEVPRNPIAYDAHLRTLVAGIADLVRLPASGGTALPPDAVFDLVPPAPDADVNALPGVPLLVPAVDDDTAQPLGGVRFPDAVVPLGRPVPVALGPVGTASITDVCGNWGGWQPFTAQELRQRYGDVEGYLARYAAAVDEQIGAGYLRPAERARLLDRARAAFVAAGD